MEVLSSFLNKISKSTHTAHFLKLKSIEFEKINSFKNELNTSKKMNKMHHFKILEIEIKYLVKE